MIRHGIYIAVLGGLFVYHVLYPSVFKEMMDRRGLKELMRAYNHLVDMEAESEAMKKVRVLLIYHEYIRKRDLLEYMKDVPRYREEIRSLYERVINGRLGIPIFLRYSQKCNLALFSPIFIPLLIISCANAFRLKKKSVSWKPFHQGVFTESKREGEC
jgi:hypothetical protein